MITNASLKTFTLKDLGEMAKSHGVSGWHGMKKDQLIRALMKTRNAKSAAKDTKGKKASSSRSPAVVSRSRKAEERAKPAPKRVANKKPPVSAGGKASKMRSEAALRKIHAAHEKRERQKDLAAQDRGPANGKGNDRDRLVLMVRDCYWLHATWQVNRTSVDRAQAALAEHWHTARPVLRVLEVDSGPTTSSAEKVEREIEIHGGVQNWYVEVHNPPKSYRVELGYKAANGKYHLIVRSNVVTTPAPGSSDAIDENWNSIAQDYEKVYALSGGYSEERSSGELQELFEERLRRPMGPASARYGIGAERLINRHKNFRFEVDAEMIVFGTTSPDARVTLGGEPVKLRPDGTFTVRMALPDRRQVIPAVAASADGVEQRTVVLAVERNTKTLEPMVREQNNE